MRYRDARYLLCWACLASLLMGLASCMVPIFSKHYVLYLGESWSERCTQTGYADHYQESDRYWVDAACLAYEYVLDDYVITVTVKDEPRVVYQTSQQALVLRLYRQGKPIPWGIVTKQASSSCLQINPYLRSGLPVVDKALDQRIDAYHDAINEVAGFDRHIFASQSYYQKLEANNWIRQLHIFANEAETVLQAQAYRDYARTISARVDSGQSAYQALSVDEPLTSAAALSQLSEADRSIVASHLYDSFLDTRGRYQEYSAYGREYWYAIREVVKVIYQSLPEETLQLKTAEHLAEAQTALEKILEPTDVSVAEANRMKAALGALQQQVVNVKPRMSAGHSDLFEVRIGYSFESQACIKAFEGERLELITLTSLDERVQITVPVELRQNGYIRSWDGT